MHSFLFAITCPGPVWLFFFFFSYGVINARSHFVVILWIWNCCSGGRRGLYVDRYVPGRDLFNFNFRDKWRWLSLIRPSTWCVSSCSARLHNSPDRIRMVIYGVESGLFWVGNASKQVHKPSLEQPWDLLHRHSIHATYTKASFFCPASSVRTEEQKMSCLDHSKLELTHASRSGKLDVLGN